MKCLRPISCNNFSISIALIIVLLAPACENQPTTPPSSSEQITFTGTWSATGGSQTLHLESGHRTEIFRVTGSLMLYGPQRPSRGFKADVIGFSDNQSGMQARGVWTDNSGEKVFSTLQSNASGPGTLIEGTFIGGTGRYSSLRGKYTFRWKRLINNENGEVSGRVVDLSGWAKLQPPETLPTTRGNLQ